MSSLVFRITGDPASFKAAMGEVSSSLDAAARKAAQTSAALSSIGTSLTVGLTLPVIAMGVGAVKAAGDLDVLKRALTSTTGSAEEAASQFARLEQIAKLPGIGLDEAVRGSIRLQAYGFSAGLAEKALRNFSNAVAAGGGSADDTSEALRQLGQMYGRGKVTMDNLRIILERVPQAAAIIRKEWGSEALADPAKAFEALGLTSQQVIERLIERMGEVPRVSVGVKTALENLGQEVQKSAARIGDKLVPAVIDSIPKLEAMAGLVADAVDGFTKLPEPIKNTALALGALAIAAGPVLSIAGRIASTFATISGLAGAAGAGVAALFVGPVAIGLGQVISLQNQVAENLKALKADQAAGASGKPGESGLLPDRESLRGVKVDVKAVAAEMGYLAANTTTATVAAGTHAVALEATAAAAEKHRSAHESAKLPTLELAMLMERMRDAAGKEAAAIGVAADILARYNSVTIAGAIATARLVDEQFRLYRVLEDAPDMGAGLSWKDIPNAPDPGLPSRGGFEDFERGAKNIGETGMMTREQYRAMADAAKSSGRAQSDAMRGVSTVLTDLSRGIARAAVGLIWDRPRTDVQRYKDEIVSLEAEQQRLIAGQGTMSEETAKLRDEESRLLAAQVKGHNVAAQLAVVRAKLIESEKKGQEELIAVQKRLAEANRLMGEEAHKASLGFRALEAGKTIVKELAVAITRELIEGALEKLTKKLLSMDGLLGKVFGGGASGPAGTIFSATQGGGGGGVGDLGGAAGGMGGGGGSAVGGAVGGWIGLGAGVVSAVSGVVSNFQFAHMNTALGRIEESTRYLKIYTGEQSQSILWCVQKSTEYLGYVTAGIDTIGRLNSDMLANLQQINASRMMAATSSRPAMETAPEPAINVSMEGAYLISDYQMGEFADRLIRLLKSRGVQFA